MEGKRELGYYYEGVAARYLRRQGVEILARNVCNRGGEIDLVGRDGDMLVFFEVRYRGTGSLINPLDSITSDKRQKLLRAVSYYLHRHGCWHQSVRIDVVGISPGRFGRHRIEWIRNAIQAD